MQLSIFHHSDWHTMLSLTRGHLNIQGRIKRWLTSQPTLESAQLAKIAPIVSWLRLSMKAFLRDSITDTM